MYLLKNKIDLEIDKQYLRNLGPDKRFLQAPYKGEIKHEYLLLPLTWNIPVQYVHFEHKGNSKRVIGFSNVYISLTSAAMR